MVQADSAIVVTADTLQLADINQEWLTAHNILAGEALVSSTFSAQLVFARTQKFQLMILPNRVQLSISAFAVEDSSIPKVLTACIAAFPEAMFRAFGVTFMALFPYRKKTGFKSWTREQFCPPKLSNLKAFDDLKASFGCFFTFETLGFKSQTTVTPRKLAAIAEETPGMAHGIPLQLGSRTMIAVTNFHRDLTNREELSNSVTLWPQLLGAWQQITVFLQ